jgi:hypothetical protein
MRARYFLLILLVIPVVAGCRSTAEPVDDLGKIAWPGEIVSYRKAVSPAHGIVGYVKEYEYGKTGYGEPFRVFHVYDLDFVERGVLNQSGTGVRYLDLPRQQARVKGVVREEIPLEAQPLELNVAVILGVEEAGPVKLRRATAEDLKRPE